MVQALTAYYQKYLYRPAEGRSTCLLSRGALVSTFSRGCKKAGEADASARPASSTNLEPAKQGRNKGWQVIKISISKSTAAYFLKHNLALPFRATTQMGRSHGRTVIVQDRNLAKASPQSQVQWQALLLKSSSNPGQRTTHEQVRVLGDTPAFTASAPVLYSKHQGVPEVELYKPCTLAAMVS